MAYPQFEVATEFKANGELSRMRSHKGNAPTLPQTKCCPLCPAKFTRTTHLHRHLRSHTNERCHKCELCSAEFTRSDLLTRHRKTCGDPAMQRSRRKSCQACAESKVKCDLQFPCSKCCSRGKTCFFVNDPAISRSKKCQSEEKKRWEGSETYGSQTSASTTPSPTSHSFPQYASSPSSSSSSLYDASPRTPPTEYRFPEAKSSLDVTKLFPEDIFAEQPRLSEEERSWWNSALDRSYILGAPSVSAVAMDMDGPSTCSAKASTVLKCDTSPPETELNHYLYLFLETFSTQLPIVHRHTWNADDKHPILLRAMQACGALFVRTRPAMRFISETISSTRDVIMEEFTRESPTQQDYLILAVALLQTIGLFHQTLELRESSNVWHGMLVTMIRQSAAVGRSRTWTVPDLDDLQCLENAWRDWALHETIKRGLLLSYLHDCCHCIYFDLSPSFQRGDLDMELPCDDAPWNAPSAVEWYATISSPSKYGVGPIRLMGMPVQNALNALGDARLSRSLPPQNTFAMFILIHGVLQNMYSLLHSGQDQLGSDGARGSTRSHFGFQFVLHNWMQMWALSAEEYVKLPEAEEPPFAYDGLPFYWLAQISLLAIQSGNTSCIEGVANTRFFMMKEWLRRIRSLIRANKGVPPDLWKELMVIQETMLKDRSAASFDRHSGLVSFFPDC
ncbi:hypothetical protein BDZ89DRAFT_1075398 [Hymenopellis radicata]|nr:hypothetical protein BDZ89DRAFT_1075398 [Hymenopellis radicata]